MHPPQRCEVELMAPTVSPPTMSSRSRCGPWCTTSPRISPSRRSSMRRSPTRSSPGTWPIPPSTPRSRICATCKLPLKPLLFQSLTPFSRLPFVPPSRSTPVGASFKANVTPTTVSRSRTRRSASTRAQASSSSGPRPRAASCCTGSSSPRAPSSASTAGS